MRLNLALIAHHLRDLDPMEIAVEYHELDVADVRLWPQVHIAVARCVEEGADTVYIGTANQLLDRSQLPGHVICVQAEERDVARLRSRRVQALVCADGCAEELFDRIRGLFRHYDELEHRLVASMLDDRSIDAAMDACSRFFQNPTFLLNEALRIVALCKTYKHRPDDAGWNESMATGYLSEAMLDEFGRIGILDRLETSHTATLIDVGEPFCRRLTANAFDRGGRMISLCVDEVQTPLSERQSGLMEYLARLIGAFCEMDRRLLGNRSLSLLDALQHLVEGGPVDAHELRTFLSRRGWKENDRYRVAVMRVEDVGRNFNSDRFSLHAAARLVGDAVVLEGEDDVVAIVHRSRQSGETWVPEEAFEQQVVRSGVFCGLSEPFDGIGLLHDQCILARTALRRAVSQGEGPGIFRYRDCMFQHLLGICAEHVDPICLCEPDVLALLAYDAEHRTELLPTLRCYLEHGSNIVRAAEAMFVHRNTLVYRLGRIQELVGLDLDETDKRLSILFSCKIIDRLESGDAAGRSEP